MYHSVTGKRLVECLNQRDGTTYTVRQFFDKIYVPLFFGSARLLQYVNNSPFDQEISKQKKAVTQALLGDCLQRVHDKVQGLEPDASFFLGGPASGSTETTSGQVTSMRVPVSDEDVYASWIGAALGLTVQGGFTLLIDSDDVLLMTYDGWVQYRRLLEQTPNLKQFQINTWNGQWVANRMSKAFDFDPAADKDGNALETQPWVQLLFALSYHYREGPVHQLLAYVYSLGQSNKTVGFIRLNLPEVRRLADLYRQLYTVPPGLPPGSFEQLYNTELSFRAACERTEVGLRALRPKDVFNAQRGIPKPPKNVEPKQQLAFDTYQTWIIAMLNNTELMNRAKELAESLYQFRKQEERGKNTNKNMVDDLLKKRNRREFIEGLTEVLQKDSAKCDLFEQAVADLLALPADNVPLFLTLLSFEYAVAVAKA